ncbi:MAG: ADP-ribosylglycohydrolase family protein [Polyangiales bacterium]
MRPTALDRALLALDGLSLGDAFGQRVFSGPDPHSRVIARRVLPRAPWRHSDDTAMASVLVEHLHLRGAIDRDALALDFARRYSADPARGYGAVAHWILTRVGAGHPWRDTARTPFQGTGSMGNGAAMRVAPVAAWWVDDLDEALRGAIASAEVTHANPQGIAGAVAVAAACVFAWRARRDPTAVKAAEVLRFVAERTPDGAVRDGVREAARRVDATPYDAAKALGDGREVTAPDTVPYALWCAATALGDFEGAQWRCAEGLTTPGADVDTACAIVGGVVALAVGREGLPPSWLQAREPLSVALDDAG